MKTTTLYTGKVISAGGSIICPNIVNLRQVEHGIFSLQLITTGDGTLTIEYLLSHDSTHFITPSTASEVIAGFTKTSGPESNGIDLLLFDLELAPYLKLKFIETGSTDSITVTAIFASQ